MHSKRRLFIILLILAVGLTGCSSFLALPTKNPDLPPNDEPNDMPDAPNFELVGFATLGDGTTGGAGYESITVRTGIELQAAIDAAKNGSNKRIIYVDGQITLENSGFTNWNDKNAQIIIKGKNDATPIKDLSIIGVGENAEFIGIGMNMRRVENIIIQNIKFHHVRMNTGAGDLLGVQGPAKNIRIDHCEFYNEVGDLDGDGIDGRYVDDNGDKDYYDGACDIKYDVQYLTFSWNYVHDSYKAIGVGKNDPTTITFHHNFFENCGSRLPSFRDGFAHVFNNYYKDNWGSAVNSRGGALMRVEGNVFENTRNAIGWYFDEEDPGFWDLGTMGNQYINCTGDQPTESTGLFDPSTLYEYTLHSFDEVKELVPQYAGVGKLQL
ncbi:MAG TPA: pectate lyase [Limnochordia bacterium]|nr:pectate lyase [Limnochordia bacterium]